MWWYVAAAAVSAIAGASSSSKARRAQAKSDALALAEQQRQFDLVREDTQPYRETGKRGLFELENYLTNPNADYSKFYNMPGTKYRMEQGENALKNYLSAKGITHSGRALQELQAKRMDLAGNEFNNYLSQLGGLANYGVGGTSTAAQFGGNASNNISNLYSQMGANQARGIMGQGAAWNNAVQGSLQNAQFSSLVNNKNQNQPAWRVDDGVKYSN